MYFRIVHAVSLFFAFTFGGIGGSVGLSAILKGNSDLQKFVAALPTGSFAIIDTTDILSTGAIITIISFLITVNALVFLAFLLLPTCSRISLSSRTLQFQALNFLILGSVLFAALVPYTLFIARRAAGVSAWIGAIRVPTEVVEAVEEAVGWSGVYKDVSYLRLVAILPWLTFFFSMVAAVVSFVGLHRYNAMLAATTNPFVDEKRQATPEASERGDRR